MIRTDSRAFDFNARSGPATPCCGAPPAVPYRTPQAGPTAPPRAALDAKTGKAVWDTKVQDYKKGQYLTLMPLMIDGKVIVGGSGGEFGVRGYVVAYDANSGKELWRTFTIPAPGEPGSNMSTFPPTRISVAGSPARRSRWSRASSGSAPSPRISG
jgi:hypothetical protein